MTSAFFAHQLTTSTTKTTPTYTPGTEPRKDTTVDTFPALDLFTLAIMAASGIVMHGVAGDGNGHIAFTIETTLYPATVCRCPANSTARDDHHYRHDAATFLDITYTLQATYEIATDGKAALPATGGE